MKKIMRIAVALALVVILLVVGAQTALADTNTSATNASVTHAAVSEVKGIITAIDKTATPPTVTITPKDGSAVVLKVDTTTVITKSGTGKITINDLIVNDPVTATYNKDTNVAGRIMVMQPPEKHRAFEGTIKSIATPLIVVTEKKGDETFQVNTDTQYKVPGVKDATLDNFKVGDKVSVLMVEANTTTSTAVQIAQRLTLIPARPIRVIHTGTVTAYSSNTSITIQDKKGTSTTFIINSDTKIHLKKGLTGIAVGDQVIVTGQMEPSETQFTAKMIMDRGIEKVKNALTVKNTPDAKGSAKTEKGNPAGQAKNNVKNSIKNNVQNSKNK